MGQVGGKFAHVQASNQLAHRLCAHSCTENATKGILQFAVAALLQQVHFLQPLQVTPQLLQMLAFADPLRLQLSLYRANLPLVLDAHSLSFVLTLLPYGLDLAARVFSDVIPESLGYPFQYLNVLGCHNSALLHDDLSGWFKDNILLGRGKLPLTTPPHSRPYIHDGTKPGQRLTFSSPCSLQISFTLCFQFHLIDRIATSGILDFTVALPFQAIHALDDPAIQALF